MLYSITSPATLFAALSLIVCVFCQSFSLPKLPFRLEPKLIIPSGGSTVLFPDFPGASTDTVLARFRQSPGPTLQLFRERDNALHRFSITYPTSEAPVLVRLGEKAAHEVLSIHLSVNRSSRQIVQLTRNRHAGRSGTLLMHT
jgi:hypothetical protein